MEAIIYFALLNAVILTLGYFAFKKGSLVLSWIMMVAGILIACYISESESPAIRMLIIIATTFNGMKVIAATKSYYGRLVPFSITQWVCFAAGWAGMKPQPFETLGSKPLPNAWPVIRYGIGRMVIGFALIGLAHLIAGLPLNHNLTYSLVSVILLIGFSLILHFGVLSISAGTWRLSGVNTYLLFKQPAKAITLAEFWSKRWNIAFSEMTSITIFRPLKNKAGNSAALMASFMFSGLLHELALSVPVRSGYGLPMLYFIIQGAMVLTEKLLLNNKASFLHNKTLSRPWTMFWVVIPAPLLFHAQFIKQIVWPLAGLH